MNNQILDEKQRALWNAKLPNTKKMPVFFLGHGSPINAIEHNEFTQQWNKITKDLESQPTAILCISAHWLTQGFSAITAMQKPETIHDFGGFPQQLREFDYPAIGNLDLIEQTIATIQTREVRKSYDWGLDHGAWGVLCHVFPEANIPVVQLSIDYQQNAYFHYDFTRQLASLRRKGVLIIASGNMVHNLRRVDFSVANDEYGYDWAYSADQKMKQYLLERNHQALLDWQQQGQDFLLSIPTPDHYYPMLYALGLQEDEDQLTIFNDKVVGGAVSMTSFRLD